MAEWPSLDDLKRELGVALADTTADATLTSALAAATELVITDTGRDEASVALLEDRYEAFLPSWVMPELVITEALRQAALLMAVTIAKAPEAPYGIAAVYDTGAVAILRNHPTYLKLIKGSRVSFGVA